MTERTGVPAGEILITYDLEPSGDISTQVVTHGDLPLVVLLGLLRMAEDTLLQGAADEV